MLQNTLVWVYEARWLRVVCACACLCVSLCVTFPYVTWERECVPVTKCSTHHRNCSSIFLETVLKRRKSICPLYLSRWGAMGIEIWKRSPFPLTGIGSRANLRRAEQYRQTAMLCLRSSCSKQGRSLTALTCYQWHMGGEVQSFDDWLSFGKPFEFPKMLCSRGGNGNTSLKVSVVDQLSVFSSLKDTLRACSSHPDLKTGLLCK